MIRHTLRVVLPALALMFVFALPVQADYQAGKRAWEAGKPVEALREWRAAADAGDRRAMLALGRLYMRGIGAPQDYIEAHMWLNLAASRGEMAAVKERDALASRMTPQQVASAQARTRSWRPGGGERKKAASPPPASVIRTAQGLLAKLGYDSGPADGRWGESTARAYAKFLQDAGLPPGNTLTPVGLRTMRAAAKRQRPASLAKAPSRPKIRPDALHRAVLAGNVDGLKAALKARADVNARDARGWTALMHAANKGYAPMVESLLEAKTEVDARAADGATALFMAAAHGHSEVIKLLTKAGADPKIEGPKGRTAEGLIAARVARNKYGGTRGLHKALRANEGPAVIKALLALGADIRARDVGPTEANIRYFYTPLQTAVGYSKHPEIISLLLESGADPNEKVEFQAGRNPKRSTTLPLWVLATRWNENPAVTMFLLDRGNGVNSRNGYRTPLHLATRNRNPGVVKLLLERGADVSARDEWGRTPLYWAGLNKNPEVVKLMLAHEADVNARDKEGRTPLFHAMRWSKNPEVVNLMLKHGADLNVRDNEGRTPQFYLEQNTALKGTEVHKRLIRETDQSLGDSDTPSDNEN